MADVGLLGNTASIWLQSISDHCKTLKCLPIIDQQSAVAADDAEFDMASRYVYFSIFRESLDGATVGETSLCLHAKAGVWRGAILSMPLTWLCTSEHAYFLILIHARHPPLHASMFARRRQLEFFKHNNLELNYPTVYIPQVLFQLVMPPSSLKKTWLKSVWG